MRSVPVFRWSMASQTIPGKRTKTAWHMTEAEALALDPNATPLPGSGETRVVPEDEDESRRMHTHAVHPGPARGSSEA
jgi:hypothetical protein